MLRLSIFGRFQAADALGNEIPIKSKKARALLAYLALPPGKERSREEVMALLWSERGDEQARSSLRQALSGLRKELGEIADGTFKVTDEWLALDPELVVVEPASPSDELLAGLHINDPAFDEWLRDERLRHEDVAAPNTHTPEPPLSDKPSIAVMPFDNLSNDPEQAYFADGIVEDLITALSRFPWLYVIARNSSFSYKERPVQAKQVSQELGVRYLIEGSIRSSSTRLRVTAQLIDASNDRHLWAQNYDRPTGDLFDLQDEICRAIVGVLVPALSSAERERSLRSNRPSLDAWEAYQKGLAYYYRPYSDENHAQARRMFDRAIELDEGFADAHAMVALMGIYAIDSGQSSYTITTQEILAEAAQAAKLAVQLEDNNALAHMALGRIYDLQLDGEAGVAECQNAIDLNPNLAIAHHELGFVLYMIGRSVDAVSCFDQAIRLSPNDPSRWNFYLLRGFVKYELGEFEASIKDAKEAARMRPSAFWPLLLIAASSAALNRMGAAEASIKEAIARKPGCTIAFVENVNRSHPSGSNDNFVSDLRKAGLPE
jgi:TolB-like protein